ncbi:MAG: MaoC family dehydratase [Pseudomonadota bacterium]
MPDYASLEVGDLREHTKTLSGDDIDAFARLSGDLNPLHTDAAHAKALGYSDRIAHGMLLASWVSALLATEMPGPGTVYLRQSLEFRRAAVPGDQMTVSVEVVEKKRRGRVLLKCRIYNQANEYVLRGEAEVIAPG